MASSPKNTSPSIASVQKKTGEAALTTEGAAKPERIAKVIARAGVASRREAERMISEGRVSLNGKKLDSPAINVTLQDRILVNGRPLPDRETTQIWRFHKPRGCVTTHKDPEGRETAFDHLPDDLGRVISIGRLDYNTEGLLLLTNDGGLARYLELPATGWLRRYRVRARGSISQHKLDELKDGITVDGVRYGRIEAQLNRQDKANIWITVSIREGKNREIRRIFESLGLSVNRLIRISYGPFMLGDLSSGKIEVIKPKILIEQLGSDVALKLGISVDSVQDSRPKRKQRKDSVDDAVKSKKPGSPKGGKSLNFGGKKKASGRRDQREQDFEEGKRQRTSRRSRNADKSLARRKQDVDSSESSSRRPKRGDSRQDERGNNRSQRGKPTTGKENNRSGSGRRQQNDRKARPGRPGRPGNK